MRSIIIKSFLRLGNDGPSVVQIYSDLEALVSLNVRRNYFWIIVKGLLTFQQRCTTSTERIV